MCIGTTVLLLNGWIHKKGEGLCECFWEWTIKTLFWHCESDGTNKLLGCNGKEHEGMMCGNWNYEISTEKWGDQTTSINEAVFTEWQVTIDDVHWLRWTYIDFDLNKKSFVHEGLCTCTDIHWLWL